MLVHVPNVLARDQIAGFRDALSAATWVDGTMSAGANSSLVANEQLRPDSELSRSLGARLLSALLATPAFVSAAIPLHIYPPLFNRYQIGGGYERHVDNAVRGDPTTGERLRVDLAATMFLSDPDEYDGGELVIDDVYGSRAFKLSAGDLVLYSAGSLHMVTPVTRGLRYASFIWLQSMIRQDDARSLIFDIDTAILDLAPRLGGDDPDLRKLATVYHNLIRHWGEA